MHKINNISVLNQTYNTLNHHSTIIKKSNYLTY